MENDKIGGGQAGNDANYDEDENFDHVKGKLDLETGSKQGSKRFFVTPENGLKTSQFYRF